MFKKKKKTYYQLTRSIRARLVRCFDICKYQNTILPVDDETNREIIDTIMEWCYDHKYNWTTVHGIWSFVKGMWKAIRTDQKMFFILGKDFFINVHPSYLFNITNFIYNKWKWLRNHLKNDTWIYDFSKIHIILLYDDKDVQKANEFINELDAEFETLRSPVFKIWDRVEKAVNMKFEKEKLYKNMTLDEQIECIYKNLI